MKLDDNNTIEMIKFAMQNSDILNIHCCSFTFPNINGRAKKIYFLHDVLIATADRGSHLDKALGGNFDAIVAPSKFAKDVYDRNKEIINGKVNCYVIPRYINSEMFYKVEKEKILDDINTPNIVKEILYKYNKILFFPNRPIKEKGGEYLASIAEDFLKEYPSSCIVGSFGKNDKKTKGLINTDWIKSNQLKYFYSIADVTLNLSILPESFSQVCIESMQCETPVVAFPSGNIKDLGKEFKGIIHVEKNKKSILNGINKAIKLKDDIKFCEDMKNEISEKYSRDKIIKQYMKLYDMLLKGE